MSDFFHTWKVADEETAKAPWAGRPKGEAFFCGFCGNQLHAGDEYMLLFTNDMGTGMGGNPICCRPCCGDSSIASLRETWRRKCEAYHTKENRFFRRRSE
jgi:hypothetical protein